MGSFSASWQVFRTLLSQQGWGASFCAKMQKRKTAWQGAEAEKKQNDIQVYQMTVTPNFFRNHESLWLCVKNTKRMSHEPESENYFFS
jgi:hypothetical protein